MECSVLLKKIKLIGGKKRQGKDTLALLLKEEYEKLGYKVAITQVSKYIKMYAMDYFGWDGKEETKPRKLLQELGTDIIREKLNLPDIFIRRTIEDIRVLGEFYDVVIVSDIRFKAEVDGIKKAYNEALSYKVVRPNYEIEEDFHKTESLIEEIIFDKEIVNDGTIDDLRQIAKEVVLND